MITIDEAIAKHKKIAEAQRLLYEACILKEQNTHFLRQGEEHEQLAKWLEELKTYRECNVCEYNKAIDDFAEKLCDLTNEKSTNVYFDGMFCDILTLDNITDLIFMIAEQLKETGRD